MSNDRKIAWEGKRVELHPGTDRWMMGDRYGKVVSVTNKALKVKLDKSGLTVTLPESRVTVVD